MSDYAFQEKNEEETKFFLYGFQSIHTPGELLETMFVFSSHILFSHIFFSHILFSFVFNISLTFFFPSKYFFLCCCCFCFSFCFCFLGVKFCYQLGKYLVFNSLKNMTWYSFLLLFLFFLFLFLAFLVFLFFLKQSLFFSSLPLGKKIY